MGERQRVLGVTATRGDARTGVRGRRQGDRESTILHASRRRDLSSGPHGGPNPCSASPAVMGHARNHREAHGTLTNVASPSRTSRISVTRRARDPRCVDNPCQGPGDLRSAMPSLLQDNLPTRALGGGHSLPGSPPSARACGASFSGRQRRRRGQPPGAASRPPRPPGRSPSR